MNNLIIPNSNAGKTSLTIAGPENPIKTEIGGRSIDNRTPIVNEKKFMQSYSRVKAERTVQGF